MSPVVVGSQRVEMHRRTETSLKVVSNSGKVIRALRHLAWLAPIAIATAAAAQDVSLRLKNGSLLIEGQLLSFDGTNYTLRSKQLGTLTLNADRFDCTGAACRPTSTKAASAPPQAIAAAASPTASSGASPVALPAQRITLHVPASISPTLLPDLIKGWTGSIGGSVVREIGAQTGEIRVRALNRAGAEIARFDVHRRSPTLAFEALRTGTADVVVTDRRIADTEATALVATAGNMRTAERENVIALDALAVVISPERQLSSISLANLTGIFSGQITDWAQLGQPSGKITVFASETTTGPGSLFETLFLTAQKRALAASAVQLPSSAAVAEAIVEQPGGIGVTAFADMRSAKPLDIEQSCGLHTQASAFSIKTEEYPLFRRIYAYTARPAINPLARLLLEFVASPAGQEIVADHQLVSQTVDSLPLDGQGQRFKFAAGARSSAQAAPLQRLLADVGPARRLSMTIRFESGTSQIESKSQNELANLVSLLTQPGEERRQIMMLGFSDTVGGAEQNAALANRRSLQARTALLTSAAGRIDGGRILARGYETLAPVACENSERGRQLNRRVELWVRDVPTPSTPPVSPTPPTTSTPR